MRKKTKKYVIIGSMTLLILVIAFYLIQMQSFLSNESTAYKTVTYSSDFSQITYSNVISPDFNKMTTDNFFKSWSGGSPTSFNAGNNPQIVSFWLINMLDVSAFDLKTCSTDYACLSCGCGGVAGAEAICPVDSSAEIRVQEKLSTIQLSWSSMSGACPGGSGAYLRDTPENTMSSLANDMVCVASGKYRACNNNGNDCGSELDYSINGVVTWEGQYGFDCHITPLPTPSGYSDIRINGEVVFRKAQLITIYRLENNECISYQILENQKLSTDYSSLAECEVDIIPPAECIKDSDCPQTSCFGNICDNGVCKQAAGLSQPPCEGAAWNDYPTCSWNTDDCENPPNPYFKYIIISVIIVVMLLFIFLLYKVIKKYKK